MSSDNSLSKSAEISTNEYFPISFGNEISHDGDADFVDITKPARNAIEKKFNFIKQDISGVIYNPESDKFNARYLSSKTMMVDEIVHAVIPIKRNEDGTYNIDLQSEDTALLAPLVEVTDDKFPKGVPRGEKVFKFGSLWFVHADAGEIKLTAPLTVSDNSIKNKSDKKFVKE